MRREYQIKVRVNGSVDQIYEKLLSLCEEMLGCVTQKDTYLIAEDGTTCRIREENGKYLFTTKGHDFGVRARIKRVSERFIEKVEVDRLLKTLGVKAVVCKNRILFRYRESVIAVDDIEHLGEFIEIRSTSEANLFKTLRALGLNESDTIKESCLDMTLARALPKWLQILIRFHDRVGELIFGITSGVLTTTGLLVGVNAATESRLAVVSSILVIAMADSLSDSFGMYLSKLGERGNTPIEAVRYAFGTFAGKFMLPLTFALPFLFPVFSLPTAVIIDLAWGAVVLSVLSVEQALVSQKPVLRIVCRNIGLAILIVCLSTLIGTVVAASCLTPAGT